MPNVIHVGAAEAVLEDGVLVFATPVATKADDTLIAVVAWAGTLDKGPDLGDLAADGWEPLLELAPPGGAGYVLRKVATGDELATIEMVPGLVGAWIAGALVVYRNLAGAPMVGGSAVAVASSTTFSAPARTLTSYSDLYLGIAVVVWASGADDIVPTIPAGTTLRADADGELATIVVFDHLAETAGVVGPFVSTITAARAGAAASLALAATAIVGLGLSITIDPPGSIGLPSKGI